MNDRISEVYQRYYDSLSDDRKRELAKARERGRTATAGAIGQRKRRQANPYQAQVDNHRQLAKRYGAKGAFTADEWRALCAFYGHNCLRCGLRRPLSVDHIVPMSQGGSNNIDNIQPLCKPCNSAKGSSCRNYRLEY
jgi:5-methylcytosine-specific restriction endonuclease McrA